MMNTRVSGFAQPISFSWLAREMVRFSSQRRGRFDREGRHRVVGRERPKQDQAAFGGGILWVHLDGGLQAIQAFLLCIHDCAEPDPILGIFLVGLEQARQQIACPCPIAGAERLDGLPQHGVFPGFGG